MPYRSKSLVAVALLLSVARAATAGGPATDGPPSVRFRWPVLAHEWNHVANHVDLDATAGVNDWFCRGVSYDGHRGTDVMVRDFVEMDQGRFVVAAADGEVLWVEDGNYDRNTVPGGWNNYVYIRHDDGSEGLYLHFRTWSTLVAAGQRVRKGEPLGLVGSSGNSSFPHVHFEISDTGGTAYEPFSGPCRAGSSLWDAPQPAHGSTNAMTRMDSGLMLWEPWYWALIERWPDQAHVNQTGGPALYFWTKFVDEHPGDVTRVTFLRPNGTTYDDQTFTHTGNAAWDWRWFRTFLPTSGSSGTWKVQYRINGALAAEHSVLVDTNPLQNPVATGRTLASTRGVAAGLLAAADADSGLFEFRVASPPANGTVVLSGPRSRAFTYRPKPGFAGNDTFTVQARDAQDNWSTPATMTVQVAAARTNVVALDGGEGYVEVPSSPSLDFTTGFTLEAFVRRTTGSNKYQQIFDRRSPSDLDDHGYNLFIDPGSRLVFAIGTGTSRWFMYSTRPIPLNRWTHVAVTWDGTYQRMFIDGVEEPAPYFFTGPVSYSGTGALRIGGSHASFENFRGEIDEARAWSIARSPAQIAEGISCTFFDAPVPAAVRGLWRFEDGSGDASSSANHASLFGTARLVRTDSGIPLNCTGPDRDGDGRKDGADNCPLQSNTTQTDGDGDRVGDACDLCGARRDPSQADSDADGVGDACDDCPFAGNTEQTDTDGDGAGDVCDPRPGDNGAGVPGEVTLTFTNATTLTWTAEPRSAGYDVFRGARADLLGRFYGTCQNARDPNTSDRTFLEAQTPAAGDAFFFLVRGVGADGTRGLAGLDSGGRARDLRAKDCR